MSFLLAGTIHHAGEAIVSLFRYYAIPPSLAVMAIEEEARIPNQWLF
jgi:hypothetical protein